MWSTAAERTFEQSHERNGQESDLAAAERAELERQFDRLLAANGAAVTRLAASYTNTPADRDDLVQEIALAIWRGLPHFRGECSERTFLFRIAHNRAVSYVTRRRTPASVETFDVPDPALNPEAGLAREQQGERLHAAVRALPLLYRQVVTLMLEGMDYSEIAQVLGLSESNVGARLSRARQMLREAMEVKR
jgi:RNA polymerase sigma-70 factor (ECF subfamily)